MDQELSIGIDLGAYRTRIGVWKDESVEIIVDEVDFKREKDAAAELPRVLERAKTKLGGNRVTRAVIGVPSCLSCLERKAIMESGRSAGFGKLDLINYSTAAALAYGFEKPSSSKDKAILVFDLGASKLEIAVVMSYYGFYQVISTSGNKNIGGDSFVERLLNYVDNKFKKEGNIAGDPAAILSKIKVECEKAKLDLSSANETEIKMGEEFGAGTVFISRTMFEQLNKDLFQKCIDLVDQSLKDAEVERSSIEDIVLVGGSTKIPKIQQLLGDYFEGRKELMCRSSTMEEGAYVRDSTIVAYGATVQAAIRSGDSDKLRDLLSTQCTGLSIWMEKSKGNMSTVIPRTTTYPCTQAVWWFGGLDCEAEEEQVKKKRKKNGWAKIYEADQYKMMSSLGEIEFESRRSMFRLYFSLDWNGILSVSVETENGDRCDLNLN